MAVRQGVHFSYLVVALVICLGLIFFVVLQNSDLSEAQSDLGKKDNEIKKKESTIKELTAERNQLRRLLIGDEDLVPDFEALETKRKEVAAQISQALDAKTERDFNSYLDVVVDSHNAISFWRNEFNRQRAAAESKDEEYKSMLGAKESLQATLDERVAEMKSTIDDQQLQAEQLEKDSSDTIARLREEMEENNDEATNKIEDLERDMRLAQNLIIRYKDRIDFLEREINKQKNFGIVDPDGEVLQVSEELGLAWIDIGGQDRLRRGTIFEVFEFVKGGKRVSKGRLEVQRIEAETAQCKVIEIRDRFNPISLGDKVVSPFYSKEESPIFVFAGESLETRGVSVAETRQRIENLGCAVESEIGTDTTYCVAIKGYEDTQQYKDARQFGITIMTERELLDFIQY